MIDQRIVELQEKAMLVTCGSPEHYDLLEQMRCIELACEVEERTNPNNVFDLSEFRKRKQQASA